MFDQKLGKTNLSEEARVIPENIPRLTVSFDMGW
jgi:hypothetical protein